MRRLGRVVIAALSLLIAGPAASQQIDNELEVLSGSVASTTVKAIPEKFTGKKTGLSLVLTVNSPLPENIAQISDRHREAARSICRKIGSDAVKQNQSKPDLQTLRFFVIELRHVVTVPKSSPLEPAELRAVKGYGFVFDADDDCVELR